MASKDSFRAVRRLKRPRYLGVLAAVAAASLAVGALVGRGGGSGGGEVPEAGRGEPAQRVSFLARIVPPAPERRAAGGPRVPRSIADLARRLPLERKVAQLAAS
jgi:hypothetical protein